MRQLHKRRVLCLQQKELQWYEFGTSVHSSAFQGVQIIDSVFEEVKVFVQAHATQSKRQKTGRVGKEQGKSFWIKQMF